MDKNINTGRALSVGGEDVRPSRDVQSLLIPESTTFRCGGVCHKTKELINRRMNQIIVTSYLYEVKNAPTGISDYEWDKRAKELVKLIKDNREIAKELPYYEAFENWTGDSASSLIAYFDYTVECRARLHYFCTCGKELED